MKSKIIIVNNVTQKFSLGAKKVTQVLKGISLSASTQEFLSIVGPSGSGKSTLLNCMSGLTQPTSGQVLINGVNPYHLRPSRLAQMRRQEIGFIFQSYNLIPALPVFENIVLPLRLAGKKIKRRVVRQLLDQMNFAADLNSFVTNLSGGEKQKVAIARVLLTQAKIIFADEPTGAVDSVSKEIIFQLLRKLADDGACVVMVTHDIDLATRTDRTITLKDGIIQQDLKKPTAQQLLTAMEMR
ncbi:ABC transporter ATP-binding protein [Bombilactobacillus bombi]|uniref:ABC transporter ATP-binding protein n=1 Tax=Bombilactobacillus bombi TaxID=1303590 RepID=UPI0015E5D91E|nr:ABC transporter ATP-binding protein [Bombilactobacillus bombi]MBA1434840.1 ABC transporter ATP-binding protein [Bombilactobacillus bombi]